MDDYYFWTMPESCESDNVTLIPKNSEETDSIDHTESNIVPQPAERFGMESTSDLSSADVEQTSIQGNFFHVFIMRCQIILLLFVVLSILNFMVCCVLYVQDFDFYEDVRSSWMPASCIILRKACTCTCCMIRPNPPCVCPFRFTKSDRCSILCPIQDLEPPIDSNCSIPGRTIDSVDSYWGPGKPSCFMKMHRSVMVQYDYGGRSFVANVLNVGLPSHPFIRGANCPRLIRFIRYFKMTSSGLSLTALIQVRSSQ